ncbi:MAG: hypothetical protein A3I60_06390 [Sulfuricurvum sp. RIFCSPLOWO2_02_FULL_43_45]|nr:MAG: hypothetical protein A3I60_06390 [Sulfuricurvum sp. RIFCSPLOWO2_02_FULL_43_45]
MIKILIVLIIIQTCLLAYPGIMSGIADPSLAFFVIAIASFIDSIRQLIKKEYHWSLLEFLFGIVLFGIAIVEGRELIIKLFF